MRNPLSKQITEIQPSGIRKFFDIVSEMKDAISLGVGEPDFDTPWRVREEGIYCLERGRTFYTSNAGLQELKDEIAAMEREKIICGYHTMIDWDKAGVDQVNALIEVRVTPQRGRGFEKIAERIYNYPEVSSISLISGAYDFLVTIEGKSLMEVSRFVSEKLSPIDEVVGTATHFILKKYKDHGTILVQKDKEERMLVTL